MAKKPPIPKSEPTPPTGKAVKYLPPWETGVARPVFGTSEEDPGEAYNWDHISPRTKAIRRQFVLEFLKDWSPLKAMLRLGFNYAQPAVTANDWLREPYTQFLLDRCMDEAKDEALVTRQKVIAGLVRESNATGLDASGASRVAALGKLGKILGMEVTKVEVKTTIPGVMFVPSGGSPEEWERNAKKAQEELKRQGAA